MTHAPDTPSGPMLSVITRLGVGGSDQRLHDVLDALDALEHHIIVGAESSAAAVQALRARHRVTTFPSLVRAVDPRRDATTAILLARELRRGRYGSLMTHQSKAGLLGRLAAGVARTPAVYHSCSMASFGPGYGRAQSLAFQLAERATAPIVDRYFVVGDDLLERLAANGVDRSKLELVRSGIDATPFVAARDRGVAAARRDLDIPGDATVVAFVGRLDERKGAPRLADLFAAIEARLGRPIIGLIAGRGPCTDAVRDRLVELGLDPRIRLLGHTDQVPAVLVASDLILLPSAAEGVPQVLVQAAMVGTPFAAFAVDGAHELLVLGATGTIAPIGADDILVAHATALLGADRAPTHPWGPELLAQWDPTAVRARYRVALAAPPRPAPAVP